MADVVISATLTYAGGTEPLTRDTELFGGYRVVANAAARTAIALNKRAAGMLVYEIDTGFTYRCTSAASNTYALADSGGSSTQKASVAACLESGTVVPTGAVTVDGYATSVSDRVLLSLAAPNQALNGIYVVNAGVWTRATDADIAGEFVLGMTIPIVNGSTRGGNIAIYSQPAAVTLGTTDIFFTFNTAAAGTATALATTAPGSIGLTASVGTSLAAMRADAVVPDLLRQLGDLGSFAALPFSNYPDRHRVWCSSVEDEFVLDTGTPGLTADGITILATALGGTTRWIRARRPHLKWQKQTAWHIVYSGGIGVDEYDGTQSTHGAGMVGPLLTRSELFRRIGRDGSYLINHAVTVTVAGTRTVADPLEGALINLGPSGTWTETGVAAEAFTLTGPGLFYITGKAGVVQLGPTATAINSAEGRSMTLSFEVAFDTSDATLTTIWTFTPPQNSSCTVSVVIDEKKVATADGEGLTFIDSFMRNGSSNVVRKGSATQENFAARTSALSTATYTLAPATTTVALTVTNVAATSVRGTAIVTVLVNPD